jgi:hypothetical protein
MKAAEDWQRRLLLHDVVLPLPHVLIDDGLAEARDPVPLVLRVRGQKVEPADAAELKRGRGRRRRSRASGASTFERGECRQIVVQVAGLVVGNGQSVGPREIQQSIGCDAQRGGGCPPSHPLATDRIEDQQDAGALSCVRICERCRDGDGELYGVRLHVVSLPRALRAGEARRPRRSGHPEC